VVWFFKKGVVKYLYYLTSGKLRFKEKVLTGTGLENLGLVEMTDKLMDIPGKIEQKNRITKLLLPLYHNYSRAFVCNSSLPLYDTS